MNGIHDLGGMHGFGPINPQVDEPVFHAPWEGRALAMTLTMAAWGRWNIDSMRHARELVPQAEYLHMSYYERWFTALIDMSQRTGLITPAEVESAAPMPGSAKATPPVAADMIGKVLSKGAPFNRERAIAPRFTLGDTVQARNIHPEGHTRLPRYARGKQGIIARNHGIFVFADSNAHHIGEDPQHLYSVRFEARTLWGENAGAQDYVHIDLWESHLEPA